MNPKTKGAIAGAALVVATGATAGIATASGGGDSEGPLTGDALQQASDAALEFTGGGEVTETEVGDEEATTRSRSRSTAATRSTSSSTRTFRSSVRRPRAPRVTKATTTEGRTGEGPLSGSGHGHGRPGPGPLGSGRAQRADHGGHREPTTQTARGLHHRSRRSARRAFSTKPADPTTASPSTSTASTTPTPMP